MLISDGMYTLIKVQLVVLYISFFFVACHESCHTISELIRWHHCHTVEYGRWICNTNNPDGTNHGIPSKQFEARDVEHRLSINIEQWINVRAVGATLVRRSPVWWVVSLFFISRSDATAFRMHSDRVGSNFPAFAYSWFFGLSKCTYENINIQSQRFLLLAI